jgi:hypothetical protein
MKNQIILFILLVVNLNSFAQSSTTTPPDLRKLSYDDANKAIESEIDLIGNGKIKIGPEYITNLLSQLRSNQSNNENQTLDIYLLGMLRTTNSEVIHFLIENIDFKATHLDPIDNHISWLSDGANILPWMRY